VRAVCLTRRTIVAPCKQASRGFICSLSLYHGYSRTDLAGAGIPPVLPAQDILDGICFRLGLGQLTRPGHASADTGSWTTAAELGITGGLFLRWIVPIVPARGAHVRGHLGIEKYGCRVGTPGPADNRERVGFPGDFAVREDVAVFLILWRV